MLSTAIQTILSDNTAYKTVSSGGVFEYMAADTAGLPYTIIFTDNSQPINSQKKQATKEHRDVIIATYATTPSAANTISNAARLLLDKYSGTIAGVKIERVIYEGVEADDYDREQKKAVKEIRLQVTYEL